jgi:hypothetical protein
LETFVEGMNMKQRWIFRLIGTALALFCLSCTGFFEIEGEEEVTPYAYDPDRPSTTNISFDNRDNRFMSVDVFSSYTRDSSSRVVSVSKGVRSGSRSWISSEDMGTPTTEFYLTYYVPGMAKGIPYIPRNYGADIILWTIPRDQSTEIKIPNLQQIILGQDGLDDPLFGNEVYLVIKNEYPSAIQLNRGGITVTSEDGTTQINLNDAAVYKIPVNAAASSYKLRFSTTERNLPEITFHAGYVYEITYTYRMTTRLDGSTMFTMRYLLANN